MSHSYSHARLHGHHTHHGRTRGRHSNSKPVTNLEIFTSTACRRRSPDPFAGYGLYIPEHSLRIAEPLPGASQTLHKADIHALHAALELVHGTRARVAVIHHHSAAVTQAYEHKLGEWHSKRWRQESGRRLHNRRMWQEIWQLWNTFVDRGVEVSIKLTSKNASHNMRVAHRLARWGAKLHVMCELCRKSHGRQWASHRCKPICDLDKCEGRVLKNVHSYMKHVQRRHQRKCRLEGCNATFGVFREAEQLAHEREAHGGRVHACSFCGEAFKSEKKVKKHVRNTCREAPFCADCGRLFKSKRELERHNERKTDDLSDEGSDSETEEEEEVDAGELANGDFASTMNRLDLGRHPLVLPVRDRSGVDLLADDEDDDSESGSDTESDLSTSSSDPEGSAKCRRRNSHHGGGATSSASGSLRGSASGRRLRRANTHHTGEGTRRGGTRRSPGTRRPERKPVRGMMVKDRQGRDWEIDEFGLHARGEETLRESVEGSVSGSVGRAGWDRYGRGSE